MEEDFTVKGIDEVRLKGFRDKKTASFRCWVCGGMFKENSLKRIAPKGEDVKQSRIWACPMCRELKKKLEEWEVDS